jgi:hypothetical protein
MEDKAGAPHRQGNLTSVKQRSQQTYFSFEFAGI